MAKEEHKKQPDLAQNGENLFSPRFKSVAAMAGWDEEAILVASLVVEDTPDRNKVKKRSDLQFKTPPSTNSRRAHRRSPISIPILVLDLDEKETAKEESEQKKVVEIEEKKKIRENELKSQDSVVSCSNPALPCMDKLREELSCAICLEICFEPSTTPCGHSFCKKCLRSAADKCGKRCPKCRQLISNGRSCKVNTVLWNTIQLLFPQEVEARKAAGALNSREAESDSNIRPSPSSSNRRDVSVRRRRGLSSNQDDNDAALAERLQREDLGRLVGRDGSTTTRRRRGAPALSQNEDAALALRLQREEFMGAFRETSGISGNSLTLARANLRAMASRAINIRARGRAV
ncbi:putative E3 ubiquitin-protein ligase RING1a isoform X2 [Tripterygium wilfordii]|uniref:putative E3 ubiquitin-protein ligase RING1a isoform X2 n=1 Tax=Tripterygium wilfordii TaxID=458696 RepID=UPI0018F7F27D|nr:putative E3 ubiquitin-protein ligase RING1a isoform X2 [Tripterygium wilfordii]